MGSLYGRLRRGWLARRSGEGRRLGVGQEGWTRVTREEGFEDESCGDLIDEVLAVEAGGAAGGAGSVARGVEEAVSLERGEALVEEMERECGMLRMKGLGEGRGFGGLRAGGAVGVERVSDDECGDVVLADETSDRFEVSAQGCAMDGEEGLRGEAERIGDGEADAAIADVEREDARGGHEGSVAGEVSMRRCRGAQELVNSCDEEMQPPLECEG